MRGILNIDKGFFPSDNPFGFPELERFDQIFYSVDWFSFNKRKNAEYLNRSGVHFYIDDFCFEAIWKDPKKYINDLKNFMYVVQPDFSLYYNFPQALQIYNKYRNHWLCRYFSFYGVNMIPNINVSTPECWEWSFLGYPSKSIVAFSDIGSYKNRSDREILLRAYEEMIKRLEPLQILYFTRNKSNVPNECIPIEIKYGV